MTVCIFERDEMHMKHLKALFVHLLQEDDTFAVNPSSAKLLDLFKRNDCMFVLIDTRYPVKDGNFLLLARKIRELDEHSHICFMSPSPADMALCYGKLVRPSAFFLAPVDEQELADILDEVETYERKRRKTAGITTLVIKSRSMTHRFFVNDVIYLTMNGKQVGIYSTNEPPVWFYGSLTQIEADNRDVLLRCHSGFLVNKAKISGFDRTKGQLLLFDGTEIPVSRRNIKEVMTVLSQKTAVLKG